jgi:DNA end-binding protein Ku
MSRAMWRAVLSLGRLKVPVKLYAAVEDRKVRFHLLHGPDRVRVVQRMVDPQTGDVVDSEQIRKGFPLDSGVFVALEPNELEAIAPKPSREIEVSQLVTRGAVPAHWFDRPYYLGPDGMGGDYAACAQALEREGCDGIAHWVMRGRRYAGLLHPREHGLCLVTLHAREEVLDAVIPAPAGREGDARELALAEQLISALQGELSLEQFHDEHRERVLELIEQKAKGEPVSHRRPVVKAETKSSVLEAQLRASVSQVGKLKPLKAVRPTSKTARRQPAARAHTERRSA